MSAGEGTEMFLGRESSCDACMRKPSTTPKDAGREVSGELPSWSSRSSFPSSW
jgi:hypothetical protein